MEKKYREVFDGVRASERLRKEVLEMKYLERKETRYALRPALAAVLAVLLLAACAAVPGAASALADYFSERWSEQNETALTQEQLDFIGAITQTVGVSDTVDGVTVTLEAVTAGESSLWMLLTMDGLDVPAEELVDQALVLPVWVWSLIASVFSLVVGLFYVPNRECVELGYFEIAKRTSGVGWNAAPPRSEDNPNSGWTGGWGQM